MQQNPTFRSLVFAPVGHQYNWREITVESFAYLMNRKPAADIAEAEDEILRELIEHFKGLGFKTGIADGYVRQNPQDSGSLLVHVADRPGIVTDDAIAAQAAALQVNDAIAAERNQDGQWVARWVTPAH